MRARSLSIVAGLAGLLAACEGPAHNPLGPNDAAGRPMLGVSAAGGNGATIDEFDNIVFFLIYDAERELLAAHMPSNICGEGAFNVVHVRRVTTPSQIGQLTSRLTDREEQVAIYHAASLADAGMTSPGIDFMGFPDIFDLGIFCAFLEGPNLIAEGPVNRLSTFSLASFHGRWTGILQAVDGREYHLTEIYQLNADAHDPNNPATFTQPVASIRLTPEP
jgi:hypothetical protein